MNREVYALQLIDEETGEVLKDVTPITESKSVIHDGEKLSEVLDLQRDKIQEQSKSNLVLVTTMQKLLSEKIEGLNKEYRFVESVPTNLIEERSLTKKLGDKFVHTNYTNIPEEGVYILKCKATIYGDKKPDGIRIGEHAGNIPFGENGSMVEKQLTLKAGKVGIPFYAGYGDIDSSARVGKYEDLFLVRKDDYLIETPYYRNANVIKEELDFYKSQLEKLKLTQEVDLNLLLTL